MSQDRGPGRPRRPAGSGRPRQARGTGRSRGPAAAPGRAQHPPPQPQPPQPPQSPPDRTRATAYDALRAVTDRGAYANLVLPSLLRERGLSGRDAALATELTYGTLRAQGTLDAVLAQCSDRPLSTVDDGVLDVLRLGAYQLLYTRVLAHAAVSTTVDLAPRRAAGFVNAVLRRVARSDLDSWIGSLAPAAETDPIGNLAVRHSHPAWIVTALRDALGGDLAETEAALRADDARPTVHLAARPGRVDRDALATEVGGTPGPWSPYAVHLASGDPGALPAVRDGRAGVQDEGSQLAALALAAAPLDGPEGRAGPGGPGGPGGRWLDLCAGPGGKAALLGGLAAGRAARVLAVEPRAHRARLTAQTTAGLPVLVVQADGRAPAWADGSFDRVLVDAPCSGLGALRRRPEARWRRQPSDLPALTRLQRDLLTAALAAVRPGGVVGYVTCSPHAAETRAVVAEVTRAVPAEPIDARPLMPGLPDLGPGPTVQLWPHRHGTDAMFIALLARPGG